ncbi:hypothetical protein SH591_07465 [Sphingomonas sp. LY54]|uniref:hypothetical protein n=1 Tax=Sphingomonas sp. LY54 TaxID=3095343 RepID=UPI002D77A4F9|nr:hypothetical protein [Sphingomonas sp. LY54]WRP30000.1 hypothetical protein SH591_07465 [Sphingomonas sp. LY54]
MAVSGLSKDRIEIHFDVHEPVELTEMTLAFQGLSRDYKRFLKEKVQNEGGKIGDEDIKLYITKIESNCILAEFAGASSIVGAYFSLLDYQNIFIEYVKHFDVVTSYFKTLAGRKDLRSADIECTKAGAQAIESVMALVAKTKKGRFALRARAGSETGSGHKVYAEVELSSNDAAEVQRGALIAQKVLDYRGDADHKNVLMYFQRTSTDDAKAQGRTDDKAIIRSISEKPLPVHFASQLDQERINDLKSDPKANPFKAAYRVDVNVETDRKGIARFYRVVHLHEILPEEEDDDAA